MTSDSPAAGNAASGPTHVLVNSPNKPRPSGLTLEIADMLRRIEHNYEHEGSGPGSRFEGRLLEDMQAEAAVRRVREHCASLAESVGAAYLESCERGLRTHRSRPFADLLREDGND